MQRSTCHTCGADVIATDKFCGHCGTKLQVSHVPQHADSAPSGEQGVCSLCGQRNSPGANYCESCGNALTSRLPESPSKKSQKSDRSSSHNERRPLNTLQSWKVTVILAAIFVAVLVGMRLFKKDNDPHASSPKAAEMISEIKSLQTAIEQNPKDDRALLRLANIYYDTKIFDRAIMMYDRYLEINPTNPDARVDMGTSYFELAMSDSVHRTQYFQTAKEEMEKALTYAPQHQMACFNLGMVSLHMGDAEKAQEWFTRCAKINPESETGQRAQQLIKQFTHSPS